MILENYLELKDHIDEIIVLCKLLDYSFIIDDYEADTVYRFFDDGVYIEDLRTYSLWIDSGNAGDLAVVHIYYIYGKIIRYNVFIREGIEQVYVLERKDEVPIVNFIEVSKEDLNDLYIGLQEIKKYL